MTEPAAVGKRRGRPPDPITCPHKERPHYALGLCRQCYFVHWRRSTKDRYAAIARRLAELERDNF